jgi:hypothetical protein
MTNPTPDDERGTPDFKIGSRKVASLLRRLDDNGVCPCCAARAMAFHAAFLAEQVLGSADAVDMLEDIIDVLRENDVPAPNVAATH